VTTINNGLPIEAILGLGSHGCHKIRTVRADLRDRTTTEPYSGPDHVCDFRIRSEYLSQGFREFRQTFGGVDLPEKLLDDGLARIGEADELIVVSVLVATTDGQPESVILNRNIPSPVLREYLFGLESILGQMARLVIRQLFAPDTGIDFFLLALVWCQRNTASKSEAPKGLGQGGRVSACP
jgi:hypothetical protein